MITNPKALIAVTASAAVASALLAAPLLGPSGVAGAAASTVRSATATATAADAGLSLQEDFVRAVGAALPSVVEISTNEGLGSGVVYDNRGDIVTNAHVVGTATQFTVTFADGTTAPGTLVGAYAADDLAVVHTVPVKGLQPAKFASAALRVGDIVLAVGNPLGLSSTVTEGIVSFTGRALSEGNGVVLPDLIQTSAAINPGNSGGALVNLSGQVVGIPTLAATDNQSAAPGLGFAIPSSTVSLIVPQLIAKGKVTTAGRAALGISGADAIDWSGAARGVRVGAVQANGPAAKAGISAGELVVAVNGTPTLEMTALQTALAHMKPGARVTVTVLDPSGQERKVPVTLGDLAQTQ